MHIRKVLILSFSVAVLHSQTVRLDTIEHGQLANGIISAYGSSYGLQTRNRQSEYYFAGLRIKAAAWERLKTSVPVTMVPAHVAPLAGITLRTPFDIEVTTAPTFDRTTIQSKDTAYTFEFLPLRVPVGPETDTKAWDGIPWAEVPGAFFRIPEIEITRTKLQQHLLELDEFRPSRLDWTPQEAQAGCSFRYGAYFASRAKRTFYDVVLDLDRVMRGELDLMSTMRPADERGTVAAASAGELVRTDVERIIHNLLDRDHRAFLYRSGIIDITNHYYGETTLDELALLRWTWNTVGLDGATNEEESQFVTYTDRPARIYTEDLERSPGEWTRKNVDAHRPSRRPEEISAAFAAIHSELLNRIAGRSKRSGPITQGSITFHPELFSQSDYFKRYSMAALGGFNQLLWINHQSPELHYFLLQRQFYKALNREREHGSRHQLTVWLVEMKRRVADKLSEAQATRYLYADPFSNELAGERPNLSTTIITWHDAIEKKKTVSDASAFSLDESIQRIISLGYEQFGPEFEANAAGMYIVLMQRVSNLVDRELVRANMTEKFAEVREAIAELDSVIEAPGKTIFPVYPFRLRRWMAREAKAYAKGSPVAEVDFPTTRVVEAEYPEGDPFCAAVPLGERVKVRLLGRNSPHFADHDNLHSFSLIIPERDEQLRTLLNAKTLEFEGIVTSISPSRIAGQTSVIVSLELKPEHYRVELAPQEVKAYQFLPQATVNGKTFALLPEGVLDTGQEWQAMILPRSTETRIALIGVSRQQLQPQDLDN